MKKCMKMKSISLLMAGLLLMTGCGSEGGRNVNSTNAVDKAISGQIAAEEQKTATEAVTESVTERIATEANTSSVENLINPTTETEATSTEVVTTEHKTTERDAEADKKLMDEIRASYSGDADMSVDIDLTAMDSDMVYATVYQMVYADPDAYVGKTFKAAGTLVLGTSSVTNLFYPYVLIKDALACCQQGVEFQWGEEQHTSIEDFPEEGSEIEVVGTFETYTEEGDPYLYTRLADTTVKVVSTPEKHEIKFEY